MENNTQLKSKKLWFRHTKYNIVENEFNGKMYKSIKPAEDASIKRYDPFELFPDILDNFYDLLNAINKKRDFSNELLEFTKMYGPLGIYWVDIKNIDKSSIERVFASKAIGKEEINDWSEALIKQYFISNHNKVLPYLELAKFIAKLNSSKHYKFNINKKTLGFLKGYSETPHFIRHNPKLNKITKNFNKKTELFINENIGITYKNDTAQLIFDYSSLLEALLSMHIRNSTGKINNERIKFCKKDDCSNWFLIGPETHKNSKKYCSKECRNKAIIDRSRNKFGFNHLYYLPKLINGNITIEELSKKQNVPINSIITAIKNYDPKSEERKKKLKKFKKTLDKCPTN